MRSSLIFTILVLIICYFFRINIRESFTEKKTILFEHNPVVVTKKSFKYALEVKKQLLRNVTNLLHKLKIKYVIGHGNLLEFTRNSYIHHDDDIDIRIDDRDKNKWFDYCKSLNKLEDERFNIKFDSRIFKLEKQLYDGIQVNLIKFNNHDNIPEFNIDIHCDLVFSKVDNKRIWIDFDINFDNIRLVKYIGSYVYAPNQEDTEKILIKDYGKDYMTPIQQNYKL